MEIRHCGKCSRDLPITEFYLHRGRENGRQYYCKDCQKKSARERYRNKDKEKVKQHSRKVYYGIKDKIFEILGRECVHCGFDDLRALQIDHINGGGSSEVRKYGGTLGYYRNLLKDPNAKEKYQILCANCNSIKRIVNKESRGNEA